MQRPGEDTGRAVGVAAEFQARFGAPPDFVVRAPGRVNLIGEHTDYNRGFVLPMAIDRATWLAVRHRPDRHVHLASLDHGESCEFDLDCIPRDASSWREYPKGVARMLLDQGYAMRGWEGVSRCDVPMGAGLSSSASFELAVARAFAAVSGWAWNPAAMACICQSAENQWVGVNCGLMDQMASALGQEGCALLIDCRSGQVTPVPMPPEAAWSYWTRRPGGGWRIQPTTHGGRNVTMLPSSWAWPPCARLRGCNWNGRPAEWIPCFAGVRVTLFRKTRAHSWPRRPCRPVIWNPQAA